MKNKSNFWDKYVGNALNKWTKKYGKIKQFHQKTSLVVGLRFKQNLISIVWFYL